MARPMRTLDHVAFMTSRFLPHASVLRPISREDQLPRIFKPLPELAA
jgi:hypothetical protein